MVVIQESTHFNGQVLVAREAEGQQTGGASHVVDTYEPVAGTGHAHHPACFATTATLNSDCRCLVLLTPD